jgi:hypothetical protein
MCYAGCETLDPPYESEFAGFFLYDREGAWSLVVNYLNHPENYYFSPYDLIPCDQPERLEVASSQPGFSSPQVTEEASASSACPGAPPQRLKVDEMAYVCTGGDTVKLREGPGKGYSVLKSLVPGAELKVTGGPECSDNWSWWEVETESGITGWMSEGGDNIDPYFLCPVE